MKRVGLAVALSFWISLPAFSGQILVVDVKGVINPPTAHYVLRVLKEAEERGVPLLIRIDTPGGLLESTKVLVMGILNAKVPVITWVYPSGARAASAGLFLLESGHVAVMASATHAGAAHPVSFMQKMSKTMLEKVTNDAVAFLRNIASKRGRYRSYLDVMVRKSKVLTAKQMLKRHLIDFMADSEGELLAKLSRRPIVVDGRKFTFSRSDRLTPVPPNFRERFLSIISHPTIAYIMIVLGFYGLLFELSNPGLIFPGVVGVLFLVLGFYSLHVLPLNYAGIALVFFSFLLFLLEVKVQSHGLLGVGGAVSFLLGSLMLFDKLPMVMKPSFGIILAVTVVTTLFFVFVVAAGYRVLRKRPVSGAEGLVGEVGEAKSRLVPGSVGWVFVHGERWKAISDEEIDEGESVEVVEVKGLTLKVRRLRHDSA